MKKVFSIAAIAFTVLALAGCNKDAETPYNNPDDGVKAVTVKIKGANLTKANMTPDNSYNATANVTKLDIYFTNSNDVIQYVYSVSSTAQGDDKTAWDGLVANDGSGVRFVGLTNISRVYVVANDDAALSKGEDIASLSSKYTEVRSLLESNAILYVGADRSLDGADNEPADDVDATVVVGDAEEASQYYTAVLSIRPVISRLEIEKIGVKIAGEAPVELDGTKYTIKWEGFKPDLYGIYMSNFYQSMLPVEPSSSSFFATPAGNHLNTQGLWDTTNDKVTILAENNVNNVSLYVNNESGTYGNLFEESYNHTEGNTFYYYYQDEATTCVPFNFFVPFNVEETDQDIAADNTLMPAAGQNDPHFHFVFYFKPDGDYTVTVYDETGTTPVEDENIVDQLTANLRFNTESGIYFANMTQFNTDASTKAEIKPNSIYKMSEVVINPFNVTTGTVTENAYNIIVRVTVVNYNEIPVLPSFGN